LNTWIEVSEPNLAHNFRALQQAAGPATEVLAVIKADAYGHGAPHCAQILTAAGARWLGVTCVEEGKRVRAMLAQRVTGILVMSGFLPQDLTLLHAAALTPVVWTPEHIQWLASAPGTAVHVEVDTGMARQGVTPGAGLAALLTLLKQANLRLEGLVTHFCSSEEAASPRTQLQQYRFEQAVAQVRDAGLRPIWIHAGNSSAVDNPAPPHNWIARLAASAGARPMVRTGIALYGYALPIDGEAPHNVRTALKPVMTWKARVLSVREIGVGDSVGYNATFTATSSMRVALLPAGYADGLRRQLSSTTARPGGWVILHGQRARILGRISMNLTVVDVTAIPQARAGDEAILLGTGITADDHARLADTIPYEILCGIHPCG
jgi:alanine racemase